MLRELLLLASGQPEGRCQVIESELRGEEKNESLAEVLSPAATDHVCPAPWKKGLEGPQKLAAFFPLTACMCKAGVIVIL